MSDYVKTTNFTAKDTLAPSDPNKIVLGVEWDTEFDAKETSSATKYDSADLTDQATAETGTNNTELMTPLRTSQSIAANSAVQGTDVFGFEQVYVFPEAVPITGSSSSPQTLAPTFNLTAGASYEFRVLTQADGTGTTYRTRPTFTSDPAYAYLINTDDNSSPGSYVFAPGNTDFSNGNGARTGSIIDSTGGVLGLEIFENTPTDNFTLRAGSFILIRRVN